MEEEEEEEREREKKRCRGVGKTKSNPMNGDYYSSYQERKCVSNKKNALKGKERKERKIRREYIYIYIFRLLLLLLYPRCLARVDTS